jgi:nucleoside-diphosphate-sugar epimerase
MDEPMRVAITGASGFVGRALCAGLGAGFACRACYRVTPTEPAGDSYVTGDIGDGTDWIPAFAGADAVVHTVARTHVLGDRGTDAIAEYRRINVEGTSILARRAAEAGVRRFVFLSSIKVNGEMTPPDRPFRETDAPAPADAYGISKLEAELALHAMAAETGLDIVILRPPLIYGPGAKGNLVRLMRLVDKGLPLPLGSVRNRRSMIGLDNLVSAVASCLTAQKAAGKTYLVSDQDDLSTPELVTLIANSMGRRASLWPVPIWLLNVAGQLSGRSDEVGRIAGSLRVDSSRLSEELGWRPSVSVADQINRMVAAYSAELRTPAEVSPRPSS